MNISNTKKGASLVVLSGIAYGLLGYFGISIIKENYSVYNMLFWRFLTAATVIFIFCAAQLKKENFFALKTAFLSGAFFHAGAASLYFNASQYIGTGLAMVLFYMYPAIIVIFNRIFHGEKISQNCLFSLIIILIGASCLANIKNFEANFFGLILGICAAIFFGSYVFSMKENKASPLTSTFFVTLGCAFACLVFALFTKSFKIPTTSESSLNILGMGVLCTAIPILCFLRALKFIRAEKAAILAMSEPLSVVFFGFILLEEKISMIQLIGAIVILLGAAITLMEKKKLSSQDGVEGP